MPILHRLALLAAIALIAGLFIGGAQPVAVGLIPEPWDKVAHTSVFAAIAFLLASARVREHWGWLVVSVLLATAVGGADEIHQYFLPGRSCDWADFAADALGAILGAALYVLLALLKLKKPACRLSRIASQMHYNLKMKTATLPSIRVRPELRAEVQALLKDNESLSEFVETSVIEALRHRRNQAEFIARGIVSLEKGKLAGDYVDADVVIGNLERKLGVAKASRAEGKR